MECLVEYKRNIVVVLVLVTTVYTTEAKKRETSYKVLGEGRGITGTTVAEFNVESSEECLLRCLENDNCLVYQYQHKVATPGNCHLIHCTGDDGEQFDHSENSETFMKAYDQRPSLCYVPKPTTAETTTTETTTVETTISDTTTAAATTAESRTTEAIIAEATTTDTTTTETRRTDTTTVETATIEPTTAETSTAETTITENENSATTGSWIPPSGMTGPGAVLYSSFDNTDGFDFMEGTQIISSVQFVPGKVDKALNLDHVKSQWVDLGIHTEVCMARPETCGAAGGAISLWVNLIDCPSNAGILSSYVLWKTGSAIYCSDTGIKFRVSLRTGYFEETYLSNPSEWTHIVLNYLGPNIGKGIRVYLDGSDRTLGTFMTSAQVPAGDGRIVLGRLYTNGAESYSSVQVDELIFFNQALAPSAVRALWSHAD